MTKKENRGGKRASSGRKKAEYTTKTVSFRIRVEYESEVRQLVKDYIKNKLSTTATNIK